MSINIIPPRYAKEVQELEEKQTDDLCEILRLTAVDEGDRRFLIKRCVREYGQQWYRIKVEEEWRKAMSEAAEKRKAS